MENIDRQARQFDHLLTYSDFQKPAKVLNFLERFAAQYDLNNGSSLTSGSAASNLVSPLLISARSTTTFSAGLLMSIQNLRLGGS